jgi:hypothetical protein
MVSDLTWRGKMFELAIGKLGKNAEYTAIFHDAPSPLSAPGSR